MTGNYKFALSSDSTCDLYSDFIRENDIYFVPLSFNIEKDGEFHPYKDNFQTMDEYKDFYNQLRNGGYSRTAMLNLEDHTAHFTKMAEAGVTDAVHFTISYGLSPTVDVANQAAADVKAKFPSFNVINIESRSATIGQGMLVKIALKMRNEGKTARETADYINKIKFSLQHLIIANDLYYLKRGGRVSGASAMIGTVLKIKPFITMNREGKLNVTEKFRGIKKAFSYVIEKIREFGLTDDEHIVIVHTDNEPEALELQEEIKRAYGIAPELVMMGPVIGSHVGPGAVACGFLSKTERV
jgi:DegV family protein